MKMAGVIETEEKKNDRKRRIFGLENKELQELSVFMFLKLLD